MGCDSHTTFTLFFFRHLRSTIPRRAIGLLLLVVLCVGIIGVPLSGPRVAKNGRFPCENCPCGCPSADFCWDKCCCHSDIEKLQWADEHGVKAPDFLIARAADSPAAKATSTPKTCCHCEATADRTTVKTTCETNMVSHKDETSSETERVSAMRWVRLEDAAKCRGMKFVWTLLSSVMVETRSLTAIPIRPPFLYQLPLDDELAVSVMTSPDPPVP